MFEKAVQREGYTDTDIGKWGRFHAEGGASKMVYENGAYCWEVRCPPGLGPAASPGGPPRRATLHRLAARADAGNGRR
jgi:hypothetical protein